MTYKLDNSIEFIDSNNQNQKIVLTRKWWRLTTKWQLKPYIDPDNIFIINLPLQLWSFYKKSCWKNK